MSRVIKLQTNFTVGEINPELRGRVDLQQYESALERARNVIVNPRGTVDRRPGLKYQFTLPSGDSPENGSKLVPFSFSTTQTYMMLFLTGKLYIFRDGGTQSEDINGITGRDYLDIDGQSTFTISSASGTFTQGETITGGTSTRTAEVLADNGTTLLVRSVSGAFTATETITGGTSSETATFDSTVVTVTDGVAAAQLSDMWYVQSADTLLLFQEDMKPIKIQRGSSHTAWTVSDIAFEEIPRYLFAATETQPATTLTPSVTDGTIDLTAGAAVFHSGRDNTAQAGAAATITLDASASATNDIYNGATIDITAGTGSGQQRIISDYVGTTKVATVSVAWTTQPDSTSVFSVSSQVGQKVYDNVSGIGLARIIEVESTTVVKAITETPFFDDDAIASGVWTLQSGWEHAWSETRNWPRTGTFHEGRLLIGGSKSLPTTIWGSKVGFFFDFGQGQGLDDEGLEATIDTDQVNAVTAVMSGRDFQAFTTGTEFTVPQLDGEPLTPSSFLFKVSTRRGSASGTRPQMTEGGSIYLQRGGKSLRELIFSDLEGSFVSNDISMLSSHLLQNPTEIAMRRGSNVDEGDLLMIVNGGSGTIAGSIAAFSILRSQNVIAPSLLTTEGTFEDIGIEDSDTPVMYVTVKRTINSATVYYLETFDNNYTTDAAVQYGAAVGPTLTGLGHLETETVKVIADDALLSDATVASSQITADRATTTYAEVGLEFPTFTDELADDATKTTPLVRTMPVETRLASGPVTGFLKRIVSANIILDDTQNLSVNGDIVPFRRLDNDDLDSGIAFFTGTKKAGPFLGFDLEGQVEITQSGPLFFTLLAIDYRVSVGQ